MNKKSKSAVPTLTLTADDRYFVPLVRECTRLVSANLELEAAEREALVQTLDDLIRAGRAYQNEHGIGKPMLDLKRTWKKP